MQQTDPSTRAALMAKLSDLMRSIPHRAGCPRQPPITGNVRCTCDVGAALLEPHNAVASVIVDLTTKGSTDAG